MTCAICGSPTNGSTFCDACLAKLDAISEEESATLREPARLEHSEPAPRAETRPDPVDRDVGLDPAELDPIEHLETLGGSTEVWTPDVALFSGEAVILGEPSEEAMSTAPAKRGVSLAGFAYASEKSLRLLAPAAIPVVVGDDVQPQSPFEVFLLRRIDGRRSVEELGRSGALSSDEISVGLLSLLERGMLRLETKPTPPLPEAPAESAAQSSLDDLDVEVSEDDDELSTLKEGAELQTQRAPPRLPTAFLSPLGLPAQAEASSQTEAQPEGRSEEAPEAPPPRLPSIFLSPLTEARPPSVLTSDLMLGANPPGVGVEPSAVAPPAVERVPSRILAKLPEVARGTEISRRKLRDARRIRHARREVRRSAKAEHLRERAGVLAAISERELASGNFVGARLSLRIAVALDPSQALERRLAAALEGPSAVRVEDPALRSDFDDALRAEERGHLDTAIVLLEKALEKRRDPVVLNRLGVILATQMRSLRRSRELLEEAVRLVPGNPTYVHNLEKVERLLTPKRDVPPKAPEPKGLLRRLFGRS
ncbi:MAG: hypothetical protein HY791_05785 [Deltaproteobacteria bacterium]|nr:hypothetical protein [Deltaproteobacteria bacterium]